MIIDKPGGMMPEEYEEDPRWEQVAELRKKDKNQEAESLSKQIYFSWSGDWNDWG